MNILQIGTIDKAGGAAEVSWNLKEYYESQGHKVSMFVADKISQDPNVFTIPKFAGQRYVSFALATDIDLYRSDIILNSQAFREADIVQFHNLHGYFFKLSTFNKICRQKPVVWSLHDMWALTPHCAYAYGDQPEKDGFYQCSSLRSYPRILWHNEKYLKWRKRKAYQESSFHLVAGCQWMKDRLAVSVLKSKSVHFIPYGIKTEEFSPTPQLKARQELNLPLKEKLVLFLAAGGTWDPRKGWVYAKAVADHFQKSEGTTFLCVGGLGGRMKREGNVLFVPYINNRTDLAKIFSAADVLLLTSLADNFPLVTLEAMACGLPIVGFDVGGVKEAISHKADGFVARYKNSQDLIEGLNFIFSLPQPALVQIKEALAAKARQNYDVRQMGGRYLQLYESIIGARGSGNAGVPKD